MRLLVLLLLSVVISSSANSQVAPSAETEVVNEPAATVAVDDVADDSMIAGRLRRIFESSGWYSELNVSSDNGIVTLEGFASSADHREWAGNTARKTKDVIAVINKLDVDAVVDLTSSKEVVAKSLDTLWQDFLVRSPLLLAALVALMFTAVLAKLASWSLFKLLGNRGMRSSLKDLIYQLGSLTVWVVGFLTATIVAFPGMTPAKALTVLGLGSVAIGFAFKDIFENFFAGVLILWGYPFDRGDFIACDGITGKVEQITIRNTLIRQLDGELTVMPNATLFKNNVDVLTSQPQRRVRLICGVAYDEDVDQSRDVIRQAVQSCDSIEGIRTVEVFAQEFASSSVNFEVAWWTGAKPTEIRRSRDQVVGAIKRALDEAGIEIPYPYRTLTFKDSAVESAAKNLVERDDAE
ncbi:MAG: mechanosensitive ion channel family protein [Rubripirellula sp.]